MWIALLASSALFAIYHVYEGAAYVIVVFFVGIAYGLVRIVSGSVIPGTIAHALFNSINLLVRLPG